MKIFLFYLFLILTFFSTTPAMAKDWQYEIQPYLMGVMIDGDSTIGALPAVDLDVDTSTILENLKSTLMVRFDARHVSGWGGWADYSYMDLETDAALPGDNNVEANVRQGVWEVGVLYQTPMANGSLEYLGGLRWWNNNLGLDITGDSLPEPGHYRKDVDWVDLFVGLKWRQPLNERWQFEAQGDLGGMDADFTSQIVAGFLYEIKDTMVLTLKYKAIWVDYKEGTKGSNDYFAYDAATHGPIIGLKFLF